MPAHERLQDQIESGAVRLPITEMYHELPDTYAKPGADMVQGSPAAIGPVRAICVLVDFSDNVANESAAFFDNMIYGINGVTVRNFYSEASYGQVDIVTVNLPSELDWQRAPQTYAFYVDSGYGTDSPYPNNSQKLCEDLVDLVDGVVDFSQYDNDNDGYVDAFLIVHAGPGAEYTGNRNDIWSHKWSITPRLRDGKFIYSYAIMPEFWSSPGDMTIGVFCHEMGHIFGLPDLYDTDNSSYGIGYWSVMASGAWNGGMGSSPAHFDAWCKSALGWVTPVNISSNQTNVSIPNVENNQTIFRLWTGGATGNEYFLVENRQKLGYDSGLPSSGLLIWHVDEAISANTNEYYPGHTTSGHFKVALEQADGLYQLEQRTSLGNSGDPFPGSTNNTSFTGLSSPNSDSYAGSGSFVAVYNISPSASTMTADFAVSLIADAEDDETALPEFELSQNYPNPFNPGTNISFTLPSSGHTRLQVFNILGEKVATLIDENLVAGTHTIYWEGNDDYGNGVASGIYLYRLITAENNDVRKMLLLK